MQYQGVINNLNANPFDTMTRSARNISCF